MANLLKDTETELERLGYTFEDILSIQGKMHRISVERFKTLADKIYDEGYGGQEVAEDLLIIMKDGSWFYRSEYDGSESWMFTRAPQVIPEIHDDRVFSLFAKGAGWETLAEINMIDRPDGM